MDSAMAMHANGSGQPPATEYTLQGVMRFLQSEWLRHERDRNTWEIDRQEMRARIAGLEGQSRRADATQKALRKYVACLERKVHDRDLQLHGAAATEAAEAADMDRAAKIRDKLKAPSEKPPGLAENAVAVAKVADEDAHRNQLKTFLEQCQSEFLYLMATPANPQPPLRESPPLPMTEDLREAEAWGMHGVPQIERQYHPPLHRAAPNHAQDVNAMGPRPHQMPTSASHLQVAPSHFPPKQHDFHSQPMVRSTNEHPQPPVFANSSEWPSHVSVTTRAIDDNMAASSSAADALGGMDATSEMRVPDAPAVPETDGWEFPEGAFPEPASSQQPPASQPVPARPDTDVFPNADYLPKSPNRAASGHRRKSSMSRKRSNEHELSLSGGHKSEGGSFKLRFGLRGHLDTVRTVIFSGGGSPGEPEICTAGDDGMIKRFHIPRLDGPSGTLSTVVSDLDVIANFTHRGHNGSVLSLTSWSPSPNFSTGGRAQGDGWIFSGGQDSAIRVWERGRVDPKATLEGHTDAVWALCVLPTTLGAIFGSSSPHGSADRILLVSGAADGTVRLWSVSAPPQLSSPQPGSNRSMSGRGGRVRGNSMSSGSGFSNSPQPTVASNSPFHYSLIHILARPNACDASPTCIASLDSSGQSFVVSYSDAAVVVYDTRSGEQVGQMDSMETYDGTVKTSVNAVVATTTSLDQGSPHHNSSMGVEEDGGGPTGGRSMAGSGVEGTIISGHEDRFIRFFDANSGQCTYNMLAHPDAISSLSLSPDGRELVSAGHDASLRFWSLEKRTCTQEVTSHRVMRGEGICSCVWSQDGKWVVSGGGDGIVKVYAR
ncbi:hypothetical protein CDD81_3826 [Ophiocordyceps australis]|uniref:Striatin N-terminal domain-containing protein n=1 Tax=Ophiocordyceps australis TaxID=1399860 RepID=A0A2C5XP81_9HYPO|nr:hypothetical protein CDD81_3826 [Ophiocordyceps australis]